jgi:hypothetical protein
VDDGGGKRLSSLIVNAFYVSSIYATHVGAAVSCRLGLADRRASGEGQIRQHVGEVPKSAILWICP